MGQAKKRGTPDQRKAEAVKAQQATEQQVFLKTPAPGLSPKNNLKMAMLLAMLPALTPPGRRS